jgi:hypothetical protein
MLCEGGVKEGVVRTLSCARCVPRRGVAGVFVVWCLNDGARGYNGVGVKKGAILYATVRCASVRAPSVVFWMRLNQVAALGMVGWIWTTRNDDRW